MKLWFRKFLIGILRESREADSTDSPKLYRSGFYELAMREQGLIKGRPPIYAQSRDAQS
jgi:hypothetical protein